MPKLPQASGSQVVELLISIGYETVRQRGSHVRLRKLTLVGEHNVTVPLHKVLAKGMLSDIVTSVCLWNNIVKEGLLRKLK